MYKPLFFLCIIAFFLEYRLLYATTFGSDTAVNEFTTQQFLQNGDRVATFAWLKAGFELQGFNTTSTFDSVFPVSGTVALNAGNLLLNTDFIFSNVSSFYTLGNIIGNSHLLDLSPSVTAIASIINSSALNTYTLQLTDNLGTQVVFTTWSYDSQFLAVGLANNAGNELYLFSYDGTTLTQLDAIDIGNHAIDAQWHPSQYMFVLGCASSPQVRVYSVDPNTPNLSNVVSTFALSNAAFWAESVSYHPTGAYVAIGTTDTTQQLMVFPISGAGVLGTRTSVAFGSSVTAATEALSFNSTGEYLAMGCTASGGTFNEFRVYKFTPSPLGVTLNASLLVGETSAVEWLNTSTYILFAAINTDPRLRVYAHNGAAGTLNVIASKTSGTQIRCLSLDPSASNVAITRNNNVSAPEAVFYSYSLTGTGSFTQVFAGALTSNNVDALEWSRNGNYIAYGDASGLLSIVNKNGFSFLSQCVTFSNVIMCMNNDLYIQNACIQFAGNCAIYGNGNTLTILPTSTLSVGPNSRLWLSNLNVAGISGNNFNPIDDTGSFVFENVCWNMLNNYNFSQGSFVVESLFKIQGPGNSFIYLTDQVSTISKSSMLMCDYQTTFSYAPISNANNLIDFLDTTGILKLYDALLYVSAAGLVFTQGQLMIAGSSSIANSGASAAQGVIFGDGANLSNNATVNILPAAVLNLLSGYLVYKNV